MENIRSMRNINSILVTLIRWGVKLCRGSAWNGCYALTVDYMGVWSPATVLQELVANRCMLLIRKRLCSERYI